MVSEVTSGKGVSLPSRRRGATHKVDTLGLFLSGRCRLEPDVIPGRVELEDLRPELGVVPDQDHGYEIECRVASESFQAASRSQACRLTDSLWSHASSLRVHLVDVGHPLGHCRFPPDQRRGRGRGGRGHRLSANVFKHLCVGRIEEEHADSHPSGVISYPNLYLNSAASALVLCT